MEPGAGVDSSPAELRVTGTACGVVYNVTVTIRCHPRSDKVPNIEKANPTHHRMSALHCQLTIGHVEAHRVAGGVGRGASVVSSVGPHGGGDGEGADRGVGGRHPQLVPARPLGPAHLTRDHGDALAEVDHGVVVVPAAQDIWLLSECQNRWTGKIELPVQAHLVQM